MDAKFRGSWSGYERDFLFYNTDGPSPTLPNAAWVLGLDFDDDGRAAAPVDIDGDGDLDLVIQSLQGLRLVENTSPPAGFLRLRLEGKRGAIDALDALVRVEAGGVTQQDYARLTDGFQTQVPFELHFGLGAAKAVDRVEVTWPGGEKQAVTGVPVNRLVTIRRGREGFEAADLKRWPVRERRPAKPAFTFELAAPRLEGGEGPLAAKGRPAVVNLRAPGNAASAAEAPRLAGLAKRFSGKVTFAGVWVAADAEAARAAAGAPDPDFRQFLGAPAVLSALSGAGGAPDVPCTFVFDARGALRRVLRREAGEEELAALLDSFSDEPSGAAEMVRRASRSHQLGRDDEATEWVRKALAVDPDSAIANNYLGLALLAQNRPDEAVASLRRSAELDPEYWNTWYNLGVILAARKDFAGALEVFRRACELRPKDADLLLRTGATAGMAGQPAAALDAFDRAVRIAPRNAPAWGAKGELHFLLGQIGPAKECFDKALAIDPEEPLSRNYRPRIEKMEKERK